MHIIVTGSAGKIGRAAVANLREAKHRVVGLDVAGPLEPGRSLRCDCTDFGAIMGALSGMDTAGGVPDAVVHLAGIPSPGLATDHVTFDVNLKSTYNVFSACARLGINRIVWASSETILGLPFREPPAFVPLDESHPDRPNWSYALAKQLGEQMADQFVRWHPNLSIASLRFSNVFENADYDQVPAIQANPASRTFNLWAYVDAADAGEACRLAIEADFKGHERLIIAAKDTLLQSDTAAMMAEHFPDVPLSKGLLDRASTLSYERARAVIGYVPRYTWADRLGSEA